MTDDEAPDALRRHWAASDVNDFAAEHAIYRTDAVLEYPQSRERIRGRAHIEASRTAQPNAKRSISASRSPRDRRAHNGLSRLTNQAH
jgi:hypothetical protein